MTETPPVPGSGKLTRRERKSLATRQALIDAGLAMFEHRPIDVVSVLDITETADVAKGVFYLQFNSKDDYLLAILDSLQSSLRQRMAAAVEGAETRRQRCEAMIGAYHEHARQHRNAALFWMRMASFRDDEIGPPDRLRQLRESFLDDLADMLRGGAANADDDGARATAERLHALTWAMIWHSIRRGQPLPDQQTLIRIVAPAVQFGSSS